MCNVAGISPPGRDYGFAAAFPLKGNGNKSDEMLARPGGRKKEKNGGSARCALKEKPSAGNDRMSGIGGEIRV